jgi:hypothetical protein
MLLARNFNLVKNIAFSQQSKCIALLNVQRGFHTSLLLQAQAVKSSNQTDSTEKLRVYYGKKI